MFLLAVMPGYSHAQDKALPYYQAGESLCAQKKYDQAIQYFDAALDANPRMWQAFQGLGTCYYAQGEKSRALTSYQRALSLHPDNPSLSAFVNSLRDELAKAQAAPQKKKEAEEDKEKIWRMTSGLSQAHFELSPCAGVVPLGGGDNVMGFGAGVGGFYMFDNEFGLGGMAHFYLFNYFNENVTSVEVVPTIKYKVYGTGLRPYLLAGIGLTLLTDSYSTPGYGGMSNSSYSPSEIFPIVDAGAGLEYPVNSDTSIFLEARGDIILGQYGTASYMPVDAGAIFKM